MDAVACPSDDVLAAFFERELPEEERARIEVHLGTCDLCAGAISMMVSAYAERTSEALTPGPLPTPGSKLGRYHVLELVGAGAMGAVFSAYDPQLQRRVALKIQLPGSDAHHSDRQDRFVSEARAMATVSHPNVIAVHDVGVHADTAFFAMEFVEGKTLRRWLGGEPTREAVLEVFSAAARGLAAAHAKGLVHRDFKPDNVLVGDDGRVRVIDFGLVRFVDGEADAPLVELEDAELDPSSTKTGAIVGTPAYMAPEQLRGEPATASSDQFAFSVALFEALCGQRPFQAKTLAMLLVAATNGEISWPSTSARLPRRLREAIERGLSPDPSARFDTMAAFEQRLDSRRFGRWAPAAVIGSVVIGAVGVQVWLAGRTEVCSGAQAQIAKVWGEAQSVRVEEAIAATEVAYAPRAWETARAELDSYAAAWMEMHREACRATNVSREQSAEVMDLRMSCLDRARADVAAVVEVLGTADDGVVHNVHRVLTQLRPVERCADVERLQAEFEPPAEAEAEAVEAARAQIALAYAEDRAGRYDAALAKAEDATGLLEGVDYAPVHVELALLDGEVRTHKGQYDDAVRSLEHVVEHGPRNRQWSEVRSAATSLIHVLSENLRKPEEALRYVPLARGLAHDSVEHQAAIDNNIGNALKKQSKPAESEAAFRRALAGRIEALGADHISVAQVRGNLAQMLERQGKYDEAEAELARALEGRIAALGPEHPVVANAHNTIGIVKYRRGEYAEAEKSLRRALETRIAALGAEHPDVAATHTNVAVTLIAQGKLAEAEAEGRRAVEVLEKALGPDHVDVAQVLNNVAVTLLKQKKYDDAAELNDRALAIRQAALGSDHAETAMSIANRGNILLGQGKRAQAEAAYSEAIAIQEKTLGEQHQDALGSRHSRAIVLAELGREEEAIAEHRRVLAGRVETLGDKHPDVGLTRSVLSELLLERGELDEAIELAEASHAQTRDDVTPYNRAEAAYALARALGQRGRGDDRSRARTLGESAVKDFRESNAPDRASAVEVWLEAGAVEKDD